MKFTLLNLTLLLIINCLFPTLHAQNPEKIALVSTDDSNIINPIKDALVIYRNYDSELANTNYGDLNRMYVAEAANGPNKYTTCQSYIDFGDIKNASEIDAALLYLYHTVNPNLPEETTLNNEGNNAFNVYCVKDDWDESSITWNTKPSKDDAFTPVLVDASYGIKDFVIDVTSLVKASGKANFVMVINEGTIEKTDWVWLSTKENLEPSVRPKLEIVYKDTPNHIDASQANSSSIYPNPATSSFSVKTKNDANCELCVYNLSGKMVLTQNINPAKQDINISHLDKGIYLVKVKTANETKTQKLVIK